MAQATATGFAHDGQVIGLLDELPLKASILAAPGGTMSSRDGACEKFDVAPIDATETDAKSGVFIVNIDNEMRLYSIVVCAEGYRPTRYRYLPNDFHGQRIDPRPIALVPADGNIEETGQAFQAKVISAAFGAANELANYQQQDPERFYAAMNYAVGSVGRENPEAASALQSLAYLAEIWAGPKSQ